MMPSIPSIVADMPRLLGFQGSSWKANQGSNFHAAGKRFCYLSPIYILLYNFYTHEQKVMFINL